MPESLSLVALPSSHLPTLSLVMPQSMIVNGSVTTAGGSFMAGKGRLVASAAMIFLRRGISLAQCVGPIASAPTAQPLP